MGGGQLLFFLFFKSQEPNKACVCVRFDCAQLGCFFSCFVLVSCVAAPLSLMIFCGTAIHPRLQQWQQNALNCSLSFSRSLASRRLPVAHRRSHHTKMPHASLSLRSCPSLAPAPQQRLNETSTQQPTNNLSSRKPAASRPARPSRARTNCLCRRG